MANLGVASRFALLKIDDDDDEDGPFSTSKTKKPAAKGKSAKFVPFNATGNTTTTASQKNKKKSHKKNKPAEFGGDKEQTGENDSDDIEEALRNSQMTFEAEESRRRELDEEEDEGTKRALEESASFQGLARMIKTGTTAGTKKPETGSAAAPDVRNKDKSGGDEADTTSLSDIDQLVKTTMDEANGIAENTNLTSKGILHPDKPLQDIKLWKIYKSGFEKIAKLAKEKEVENDSLKSALNKSKSKCKKLLEIMSETEAREKMLLVMEKNKAAELNEELMQQVTAMSTELEQSRSRIHELENEHKKHPSKPNK